MFASVISLSDSVLPPIFAFSQTQSRVLCPLIAGLFSLPAISHEHPVFEAMAEVLYFNLNGQAAIPNSRFWRPATRTSFVSSLIHEIRLHEDYQRRLQELFEVYGRKAFTCEPSGQRFHIDNDLQEKCVSALSLIDVTFDTGIECGNERIHINAGAIIAHVVPLIRAVIDQDHGSFFYMYI